MNRTLEELREEIDGVDAVIAQLINLRSRLVDQIGLLKTEQGLEVSQPGREAHVLNHARSLASEGPLEPEAMVRIFEAIVGACRVHEEKSA